MQLLGERTNVHDFGCLPLTPPRSQEKRTTAGASSWNQHVGLGLLGRRLYCRRYPTLIIKVFAADVAQQTDLALTTFSSFFETISKFDAKLGNQAPSTWHHGIVRKA
jgi:hypothetical protein